MALHRGRSIILFLPNLLLFAAGAAQASEIAGRISVQGSAAPPRAIKVEKDVSLCGPEQFSEKLLISFEGFIQNAVVSLEGDLPGEFPAAGLSLPVLDQKNCRFVPHVLIVPARSHFRVGNADPVAHDVRAFEGGDMLFRFEMDAFQKPVERQFEKPGTYVIRCGLHKWMHALVVSAEHPFYAVTDAGGSFYMKEIPPGNYTLRIWHEVLGQARIPVDLSGGSVPDFRYAFSALDV